MESNIAENVSSHKGTKLKSYNVLFKLEAVSFAEQNSNRGASRKYCVCCEEDKRMERQKERAGGAKRFQFEGAGGKPLSPEMEENLLEWIYIHYSRRSKGLCVSRKLIARKALCYLQSNSCRKWMILL